MKRYPTRYPGVMYRLTASGERRYQISYTDSNNKRVFDTVEGKEKDAVRQLNQIKERMHRGELVVKTNMTVNELAQDYLRTQTGHLKESTKGSYKYALNHWVLPQLGRHKATDLSVNDLADFIATMRQEYTANTIKNCLKPISRMYQYAIRRGWVSQNPVHALDRNERPSGSKKQIRILTSDEIQQLLAVSAKGYRHRNRDGHLGQPLDGGYCLLFKTAIFTGLRKGELLALDWSDIDLLAATITVREGKTIAASREVNIPDFLVQALAAEMKTEGRVFPFDERNTKRALDAALERAGIDHIRFHDLRHTFASILISMGEDGPYVARQMGHSNIATTYKIYAHLFDGHKRTAEARSKMHEMFKGVVA